MMLRRLAQIALIAFSFLPTTLAAEENWPAPMKGNPYNPPQRCHGTSAPAALRPNEASYPICADQLVVFSQALADAAKARKLLVVDFGATWCPWCKSLQKQFQSGALADPEKFHVVEIALSTTTDDGRREDVSTGHAVLARILAQRPEVTLRAVPFLAVVDPYRPSRTVARNLDDLESEQAGQHQTDRVRTVLLEAATSIEQGTPAPREPSWIAKKLARLWNRIRGA
jgi:thiol-disulfide isomerase/thioredoxin